MTIRAHYGAPIVAGITPYTTAIDAAPDVLRSDWPPTIDNERLQRYEEFEALIENRPYDVWQRLDVPDDAKQTIAVALALPELLCNVWADASWSDPPAVTLPTDAATERWQAISKANDVETLGWESSFGAAFRGTSVLKLRRANLATEKLDDEIAIEEIPAGMYFPILRRGSARIVEQVILAWEEDRSGYTAPAAEWWQVKQWHRVENGVYTISYSERRRGKDAWRASRPDEKAEGVDFLPFVEMHAKRWGGRYWGVSELTRVMSVISQIDATLSTIAQVLEYHGDPLLVVPRAWLATGKLLKGSDVAHGVADKDEGDIAHYVEFDGSLEFQFKLLETLIEKALMVSEVSPTYFGFVEGGSLSGTALKLRLQNYLKKAGRWQRIEARRLRELVDDSLRLDGGYPDVADRDATVEMGSPLPADDVEEAQIESTLHGAGLSARKTSIRKLRRVANVDDEVKAIEEEEAMSPVPAKPGAGLPSATNPQPAGLAGIQPPAAATGATEGTAE